MNFLATVCLFICIIQTSVLYAQVEFPPQFLDQLPHNIHAVTHHDLDGDNDEDIVVSFTLSESGPFGGNETHGYVGWYENLGDEFSERRMMDTLGIFWATSIYFEDVDEDDDDDVLYTLFRRQNLIDFSAMIWKENDGNGYFIDGDTITEVSSIHMQDPQLMPEDVDGDGDQDVVVAYHDRTYPSADSNILAWYENVEGQFIERHIIYVKSLGTLFGSAYTFHTLDINNDGNVDILAFDEDSSRVKALINDGAGNFAPPVYTPIANSNRIMASGDIDDDGFMDVVTQSSDLNTRLYYGNSFGSFENGIVIDSVRLDGFHVADMESDGDLDIVAISWVPKTNQSNLVWLENLGSANFTRHEIVSIVEYKSQISCEDFDQNGVYEIFFAGKYDDTFNYFGTLESQPTSVLEDASIHSDIVLFPNPSKEWILLETSSQIELQNVVYFNSAGKLIGKFNRLGAHSFKAHLANTPPGIYFIQMFDQNRNQVNPGMSFIVD